MAKTVERGQMNVRHIVAAWLDAHGYDGLVSPNGPFACQCWRGNLGKGDLMKTCYCQAGYCLPGYNNEEQAKSAGEEYWIMEGRRENLRRM